MAKKLKRKANHFYNGGFSWNKDATFGQNMTAAFNSGALNGAMGAAGTLIGTGLSNGMSTGVGNVMTAASNVASLIPGPVGGIVGAGLGTVGGLVNAAFGSSINQANVNNARLQNENQANRQFAFSNTADILNQSNFGMLGELKRSDIGKDGWFSNKAKRLTRQLNAERALANAQALGNFNTAVANLEAQNDFNAMANYAAYGGPIMMRYSGPMSPFGNTFSEGGGIHIKPANRGKFTASAKRAGMGVQEFARHVLANKDDYSSTQVKRANFARNASKWHSNGGPLYTHGGIWDNGLAYINSGGSHSTNPYGGVQFGVDNEGVPNLVEEGEVVWNDYVFSNRLKVPSSIRTKYRLRNNKDMTFADAAKKMAKESEERPNDPISQNGLESMLGVLAYVQENERMKKGKNNNQGNKYGLGSWLDRAIDSLSIGIPDQEKPYAYFGNTGTSKSVNPTIVAGWKTFTDNNGNQLYNPSTGVYDRGYTSPEFQSWLASNYTDLARKWFNPKNAPDYFKAGNTTPPSFTQMVGTLDSPGLLYDKNYGEAHNFGAMAYNQYLNQAAPKIDSPKLEVKGQDVAQSRPLELPRNTDSASFPTWPRYAPIVASGVGTLTDALGLTNTPDYSNANTALGALRNNRGYAPVAAYQLEDYLTYRPFDFKQYLNKLQSQTAAARRSIVNQSGGNRAAAIAGLANLDYNTLGKIGELGRQADEYNMTQRERVGTFNRGTNQTNADLGLRAAMANQNALQHIQDQTLQGIYNVAQMRERAKAASDAARSANLTNFVQGLADLGSENLGWNQLQWAYDHGVFGPLLDRITRDYRPRPHALGGLLTKKRKGYGI